MSYSNDWEMYEDMADGFGSAGVRISKSQKRRNRMGVHGAGLKNGALNGTSRKIITAKIKK